MAEDDDERLRAGLDRLRSSLTKARAARQAEAGRAAGTPEADRGDSGISLGMRAGSEFVTAAVVGAGLGWALDYALGTKPAFLIVFFLLGVVAGVWNVIRMTSPKGGGTKRNSSLSHTNAADKGLRRSAPAEPETAAGRATRRGANEPSDGADDDED